MRGSTSDPTQSYIVNSGTWTRRGRTVQVNGTIIMAVSGITPGSGAATVEGLPFECKAATVGHATGGTWGTTQGAPDLAKIEAAASEIDLYIYDNDAGNIAGPSLADASDVDELCNVTVSFVYETDDA